MHEFWDYVFLDNTIRSYVTVAATILVIFLLQRLISKYIAILLFRALKLIFKNLDQKSFVNLVVTPIKNYLVVVSSILAIGSLRFPEDFNFVIYKIDLKTIAHAVAQMVLIVAFIQLLLRIIDFVSELMMRRARLTPSTKDDQLVSFFKDFLKAIIIIIAIFLLFKFVFNYPISNLVTAISIVGAALSLAAKESLENVIASFIIFLDDPFEVGDSVKVQNVSGTVEKIGLRSTRIRTDQKTLVTVPNKVMVDNIMDNISLRNQIRNLVVLDVPAFTDPVRVEELVNSIKKYLAEEEKDIINANVLVNDIVDFTIKVQVEFFVRLMPWADFLVIKNRVNLRLLEEVKKMKEKIRAN